MLLYVVRRIITDTNYAPIIIRVRTSIVMIGGLPNFISSENLLYETDRGPITLFVRQIRISSLNSTSVFLDNLVMKSDRGSIGVLSMLNFIRIKRPANCFVDGRKHCGANCYVLIILLSNLNFVEPVENVVCPSLASLNFLPVLVQETRKVSCWMPTALLRKLKALDFSQSWIVTRLEWRDSGLRNVLMIRSYSAGH